MRVAAFLHNSLVQRTVLFSRPLSQASSRASRVVMTTPTTKYGNFWIPFLLVAIVICAMISNPIQRKASIWMSSTSAKAAHIVVTSTAPSAEVAGKIASEIVQQRLVACVNSVPGVTSTYWWEGKVNVDEEYFLVMKTRAELLEELTDAITKIHPYDTPMVVAQDIVGGSKKFLDWIDASTKASHTPAAS